MVFGVKVGAPILADDHWYETPAESTLGTLGFPCFDVWLVIAALAGDNVDFDSIFELDRWKVTMLGNGANSHQKAFLGLQA